MLKQADCIISSGQTQVVEHGNAIEAQTEAPHQGGWRLKIDEHLDNEEVTSCGGHTVS